MPPVEGSAPSISPALWNDIQGLIQDKNGGGGGPYDSDDEEGHLHAAGGLQGQGEDMNFKSFVTALFKDGDGGGSPQHSTSGAANPARGRAVSGRAFGKSLVDELQEQTLEHQRQEEQRAADLKKQPKKSALKSSKTGASEQHSVANSRFNSTYGAGAPQPLSPQEMFKIQMPSLDVAAWEGLVHQVVWKLGRHFGFQSFNMNPRTRSLAVHEYVPATIILAGDHLSAVLCKCGYVRRGKAPGERDEERFAKALVELHTTIFHSYEHYWCKLVGLPWRTSVAQQVLMDYGYSDPRVLHGLLCELGLWFLIYTESSSLRHTPELMWFIYWCMTTSFVMSDFWHRDLPEVEPNMRDRRIELRNLHQKLISEVQNQLQIYPRRVRPEDCGRMSTIITRIKDSDVENEDLNLVADLVAFGDGGFYCDRIVTPIFDVFAYEVDHLSNLGVDVAHRIGYDDFNESMCVKKIIHETLRELRVRPDQLAHASTNDAYVSLTNLGFGKGAAMSTFEPGVASEFWHTRVFVKTYRERRTWAAVYRAYFRVYCFHIVAYQFLQVLAFTGWDWRMLSSCIVTHAMMKAGERFCNWFMTNDPPEPLNTTLSKVFTSKGKYRMSKAGLRAIARMNKVAHADPQTARNASDFHQGGFMKVQRRKHMVEGRPLYGVFGFLEWVLGALFIMAWYVLQFVDGTPLKKLARNWWSVFAATYLGLHLIHWVLTLRDGYMVSLTHMLNFPAIFKASSPRPDASCWMSAPMHMKWKLLGINALFWVVVFGMKLPFDYFVICKPVVEPLKIVTQRKWLKCSSPWYIYPIPCVGGDWLLLAGRVCPFIVIIFMDTSLFYQITITIFGIIRGLFKLDLGVLTSWDEVVKEFYKAPARWWSKCMSEMGNDNQLALLKQNMYIEDDGTGQITQVSDGMMFKKTVLTPEEIHGRKVHVNGRGKSVGGGASEAGMSAKSRGESVAGSDVSRSSKLFGKMSSMVRGEGKSSTGGAAALLPSSTNRTKLKMADQEAAEKRKKEEEKKRQAMEAKASAKKAALSLAPTKSQPTMMPEAPHLPQKLGRATTTTGAGGSRRFTGIDGEDDNDDQENEEAKEAGGVKGMFNRLMSKRPESAAVVDPVNKMAEDARRNVQQRKAALAKGGGAGAPNLRIPGLKPPPSARPKSAFGGPERSAPSGIQRSGPSSLAGAAPPAPSGAAVGGGGIMGAFNRLMSRGPSAAGGGEGDEVDRMARAARLAAKSNQEKKAAAGIRPISAAPPRPISAAPPRMSAIGSMKARLMSALPGSSSSAAAPSAPSAAAPVPYKEPSKVAFAAEISDDEGDDEELLSGPSVSAPGSAVPPAGGPVAEGWDVSFTGGVRAVPEIEAATDTEDSPRYHHGDEQEEEQDEEEEEGWETDGAGGQPLGEGREDDSSGSEASSQGVRYTPVQRFRSAEGHSQSGAEAGTPTGVATRPRVHRRVPADRAHLGFLPSSLGPAALWWSVQRVPEQVEVSPQQDSEPELGASPAASDVRIAVQPLLQPQPGSFTLQAGPIGEGAQEDLAAYLAGPGAGAGGSTGPDPAGGMSPSSVAKLPPIAGATGGQSRLRPNNKPFESEINDVFGAPVDDRQRGPSGSGAVPLPHSVVPSLPPINSPGGGGASTPGSRGISFGGATTDQEDYTPKPKAKKGVRIAGFGADEPEVVSTPPGGYKAFDAGQHLLSAQPALQPGRKAGGGGAGGGGGGGGDDQQLIGGFMSKMNQWKKADEKPQRSHKSAWKMPSVQVINGDAEPKTGLTGDDLEVDDVHYQMMMWNAFANAWDEVVDDVRQSDLISDKEVGMLKFVRLDLGSRHYGLRSILLPTFFYAGQIRKVVDTGSVTTAQIMVLNELRVLCVWLGCQIGLLSGKHAHVITSAPFFSANVNVKHALHRKKFYSAGVKLIELLEDMCSRQEVPFEMREFAENLFTLLTSMEGECFAISKAHQEKKVTDEELELSSIMLEVVQEMKREVSKDGDHLKVILKSAISTSSTATYKELLRVVRVIKRMLIATVAEATPTGEEAQRALGFFINSLSHPSLDRPTSLDRMWSWTVLTPLYEEDVLYPLEGAALAKEMGLKKKKLTDLLTEGDDSISLMNYLKSTFETEWNNFKERMKTQVPDIDVKELSEMDFAPGCWLYDYRMELQLWASCRGQLLGRTVSGMLRNEKALRVLTKLEHPMPPNMSDLDYQKWVDNLVTSRFEMVITPQTYGKNRDSKDVRLRWLARSIDLLLQRYPKCLKAAFLEKAELDGMGITEFSVCIKGRDPDDLNQLPHLDSQPVFEMYRVRLPVNKYSSRGVILGEGKPENQNHATIFAFGEGIQAIDMNQDGYLCEWLKFRNLLSELQPSSRGDFYLFCDDDEEIRITPTLTGADLMCVARYRMMGTVQTALVGFREYIFSEAAGALGRFAAATEYAFGTISQRTMTHPARVRLHYGHPDLFNKLFVMTKGGISKATRLLHLTEDVFCGCNHTLRGARIRYKEYISCGKGRDMGFDSINGFNFKIAGGGGEWAISRESYRMGTRLDFFRLMAFYHAAVGFYINSWFTYLAVYLNVYALLLFAWAQATEIQADSVQRVYNVQQVLQLGTLALIPYAGQLMLENGIIKTCLTLFQQIATGSLLFYTFQQQTVAASFSTDMSYGSGKYVGTGRGFNLVSLEFVKIFTLYARSHLYMAFELLFALATLYIVKDCVACNYGALTWSSWLLAVTLLFSPLWFNPFSFDMQKVSTNYLSWRRWMDGDVDATTGSNWYTWNTVQLEKIRNDGGNNTDNWLNIVGVIMSTTPYLLMALGSASRLDICLNIQFTAEHPALCNGFLVFLMATAACWVLVHVTIVLRHHWLDLANHKPWRIYTWLVTFGMIAFLLGFLLGVQRMLRGRGVDVIFLVLYANFNLLIAFHKVITPWMSQNNTMRAFSDWFYYTVDTFIGYIMFILIALLSFIGIVGVLQMKLLFNDTFSEQVKHAKIGRAMKEQKLGFDTTKGGEAGGVPASARPQTAASAFTMRTMVKSEHRYM